VKENFDAALKAVLAHEGGFSDDPRDPGGMTNLGVTKRSWESWTGHPVDEKEMRSLTPEKVGPMYKQKYWDAVDADDLPAGLDYALFDFAINSGPGRAVKTLQTAIGVAPDGKLGPKTMQAIQQMDTADVIQRFTAEREAFYKSLPTFETFGEGWMRRTEEVAQTADQMIA
jgi:lysozyme family protein